MQIGISLGVTSNAVVGLDPATATLLSAMTTRPSGTRQRLIDTTIRALKLGGVWSKMDALWLAAAHDSQAATLNWVAPAVYTLSPQSAPTFTADRGYTGNGTSSYVSTGLDLTTTSHAARDSNSGGVWSLTDAAGTYAGGGSDWSLNARDVSNAFATRNASTTANSDIQGGTSVGLFSMSRTGSAGYTKHINGAVLATDTQASAAFASQTLFLLARNDGLGGRLAFSIRQTAAAFIGAGLTDVETATLYSALLAYLQGVGAA